MAPGPWPRSIDGFLLILALVLPLDLFLLRAMNDFNLLDEGYLWYGAEAVFRGEVPLRDFHSYDPGRYYWSALFFEIWRPGLIPLRLAEALFRAVGLFFGLLAAKRVTADRWELACLAVPLCLWMYPDHRVFDAAIAMAAVWFALRVLEDPSRRNLLLGGAFVGLSAFFGRNHCAYLTLSFAAVLFLSSRGKKNGSQALGSMATGGFLGLLPFLSMGLFVPGFFAAWVSTAVAVFGRGTNIPLPVPWPWNMSGDLTGLSAVNSFLFGSLLIVLPVFFGYGLLRVLASRWGTAPFPRPMLAAVLVGTPYLHYVFSRADSEHLSVGMGPFLLGIFALGVPGAAWRRVILAVSVGSTVLLTGVGKELARVFDPVPEGKVEVRLGADSIPLQGTVAVFVEGMRTLAKDLREGESLLAFPHLPGLYPALGLRSPTWNTYQLFDVSEAEQREYIRQIERNGVKWVVVDNLPIGGKPHRSFEEEYPLMTEHFSRYFHLVAAPFLPRGFYLLRRIDREEGGKPAPDGYP